MDIDHLIKTRDCVLLSELVTANKNVKITHTEGHPLYFDYCGQKCVSADPGKKIKISLLLKGLENGDTIFHCEMLVILFLDSSSVCRRLLKQKSYDRIINRAIGWTCSYFWIALLNIVVAENDLGLIVKPANDYISYEKTINEIRKRKN